MLLHEDFCSFCPFYISCWNNILFFRMMKHGIIMRVQLRCVLYHNLCKAKLWAKNTLHITWRTASQSIWQFVKCQSLPFVPHILVHFVSNIKACKFQKNQNLDLVKPFGHSLIAEIFFHSSLNSKDTMRYICWYLEY